MVWCSVWILYWMVTGPPPPSVLSVIPTLVLMWLFSFVELRNEKLIYRLLRHIKTLTAVFKRAHISTLNQLHASLISTMDDINFICGHIAVLITTVRDTFVTACMMPSAAERPKAWLWLCMAVLSEHVVSTSVDSGWGCEQSYALLFRDCFMAQTHASSSHCWWAAPDYFAETTSLRSWPSFWANSTKQISLRRVKIKPSRELLGLRQLSWRERSVLW